VPPTLSPFVCFNFGALLQMTTITIALSPCAFTMGKSPRRVATIGASKITLKFLLYYLQAYSKNLGTVYFSVVARRLTKV